MGFLAKFSAIVKSIPEGVLGGVTLILYSLIVVTGIRIWVVNKIDFNGMDIYFCTSIFIYSLLLTALMQDSRNVFIGGVPVILATVMQTPLIIGNFQLDGIGVATFLSIILYQLLRGFDEWAQYVVNIKRFFCS